MDVNSSRFPMMRHQGSGRLKKYLGPGVMSAMQVWLWLLIFIFQNDIYRTSAAEPGYLDFDNLPETNFSCAGKVIGGYYADLETDCQMFHVCTIGQLEEPMDIKFLCLNGTVFDQETRVCERVDEVDCSKSEHFYSLNLELYGNTAPPIIKPESVTKKDPEEEEIDEEYEIDYEEPTSTTKGTTSTTTTSTTTKKPTIKVTTTPKPTYYHTTQHYNDDSLIDDEFEEYEIIDDNEEKDKVTPSNTKNITRDYEDAYEYDTLKTSNKQDSKDKFLDYDALHGERDNSKTTDVDNNSQSYKAEHFVYHHNDPHELVNKNGPAVSFQQQSFSNDGKKAHVRLTTHTEKEQYGADIMKANVTPNKNLQLSRTYLASSTTQANSKSPNEKPNNYNNNYPSFETPNRTPLIPTPVANNQPPTGHPGLTKPKQTEPIYYNYRKPQLTPQGFKPNPVNSNMRLDNQKPTIKTQAKPFQSYQPSERHEVSVNSSFEFEKLSPSYPQDYSQFHYEYKRSQESNNYEESDNIEPPTPKQIPRINNWSPKSTNLTKSLPRVIVSASASVSDSNGKKLNYTVGNILHAVKPLIPANYDDYKESDVLLDPFFLDVPKIKKNNRTKRSTKSKKTSLAFKRRKRNQTYLLDSKKYIPIETTTVKVSTKIDLPTKGKPTSNPSLKQSEGINNSYVQVNVFLQKAFEYPTSSEKPSSRFIPPDYVDDNYEPVAYVEPTNKEKSFIVTTVNSPSKATLDISTFETTTIGFANAIANINSHKKETQNYKLNNVYTEIIGDKINDNFSVKFTCNGKKYYKFYPDKTNCRTFHMCSPGLGTNQVLNIVFNCDKGTAYDAVQNKCINVDPNHCGTQ